tara:strand:+ start:98 stop:700 length:603 start_codon:yes stop_codon:yes gene_type:complete
MYENYLSSIHNENDRPKTNYLIKLCKFLLKKFNFKEGMSFLEIGCGTCNPLNKFKELKLNVTGLDVLKDNKPLSDGVVVKICNIEKQKILFEIIFPKSLIGYLSEPDNFLKESRRVFKKYRILITMVPDWESNYKICYNDHTHKIPYIKYSLLDSYNIFGFNGSKTKLLRQLPIRWKYSFLNYFCYLISPFIQVRKKLIF